MFLIIRNIFKIHLFFYIFMFVFLFTGHILEFLIFSGIIFVHEIGHIVFGLIFSWKIDKVVVLPFGCLTIFNTFINTSLLEQFIVTLMGPLFQVLFFLGIDFIFDLPDWVGFYNYLLLGFNLLPIYPLDGSKLLYVFLCLIFPFKFSHLFILFVSLAIIIFLVFIFSFDFLLYLVLLFLCFKIYIEFRNHRFIFNRFLFERYLYKFNFKRVKTVRFLDSMFLNCRHLFYDGEKYVSEREKLIKMFDKTYKL